MDELSNLSLAAKKELARALMLKQEVSKQKLLEDWHPWQCRHGGQHTGQWDAFKSLARRRLVLGGNRSGKSEVGAADAAHMFLGTHPYRENRIPCDIRVVAPSWEKIQDPILKYLLKYIPKKAIVKTKKNSQGFIKLIEGTNGSQIHLMSHNQEEGEFESFSTDHAWFDEPPPYEIWEGVRRGLIDRRGTELFTLTPIKEPWIYNKFYVPWLEGKASNTEIFELHTECNPYISEQELRELEEDYPDEETRKARLFGKFRHLQGLIYPFDPKINVVPYFEWPERWPVWMCIDPHPIKPHAVSWVGVTKSGKKVVIDELKAACTIKELANLILQKERKEKYRIVSRMIDTSIKAIDRVDQRLILEREGIRCNFPYKHDRVFPGIERVQQLVKPRLNNEGKLDAELLVRENCKGHIKEFMTYVWATEGDKPKKENDEYMDCVRYICDTEPKFEYYRGNISYVNTNQYATNFKEIKNRAVQIYGRPQYR